MSSFQPTNAPTICVISSRKISIYTEYSSFKEVLHCQQAESLHEDVVDPVENEADYLFVIRNNKDVSFTIEEIVHLAKGLSPTPNKRL